MLFANQHKIVHYLLIWTSFSTSEKILKSEKHLWTQAGGPIYYVTQKNFKILKS